MVDLGPLTAADPTTGRDRRFERRVTELADRPDLLAHYLRTRLRAAADDAEPGWITTELVGATRRKRRRHEAAQAARRAARTERARQLRELAELPDGDLLWLVSMGWQPPGSAVDAWPEEYAAAVYGYLTGS